MISIRKHDDSYVMISSKTLGKVRNIGQASKIVKLGQVCRSIGRLAGM